MEKETTGGGTKGNGEGQGLEEGGLRKWKGAGTGGGGTKGNGKDRDWMGMGGPRGWQPASQSSPTTGSERSSETPAKR